MSQNDRKEAGKLYELHEALQILADTHTRDDRAFGFVIMAGAGWTPYGRWSQQEYNNAWRVVREQLGYGVDPEKH